MANISTAFGYDVYIIPLASASVDTAFTGITAGVGSGSGKFVNTASLVGAGDTVSYAGGIFTVESTEIGRAHV